MDEFARKKAEMMKKVRMFVCMYVRMYVCIHVCMYAYIHTCMCVCLFVCDIASGGSDQSAAMCSLVSLLCGTPGSRTASAATPPGGVSLLPYRLC